MSGGAILGDRIRMTATLDDDGVFMRSLASRGYLGGLSPAAVRIIDALDAAGKDVILLETVGTGQSEIDVAEMADVRIVVTAPGLGDDIQAMKAGLHRDRRHHGRQQGRPRGGRAHHAAAHGRSIAARARSRQGARPQDHRHDRRGDRRPGRGRGRIGARRRPGATRSDRRRRRARYLIARAAADLVAQRVKADGTEAVDRLADEVLTGALSPEDAARRLLQG